MTEKGIASYEQPSGSPRQAAGRDREFLEQKGQWPFTNGSDAPCSEDPSLPTGPAVQVADGSLRRTPHTEARGPQQELARGPVPTAHASHLSLGVFASPAPFPGVLCFSVHGC